MYLNLSPLAIVEYSNLGADCKEITIQIGKEHLKGLEILNFMHKSFSIVSILTENQRISKLEHAKIDRDSTVN